jgi:hypothetical protein
MAIIAGAIIIGVAIMLKYNLDQTTISGHSFGDGLAQIQNDLKNETVDYYAKIALYQNGSMTKQDILQISDTHLAVLNDTLSKYNKLKPPEPFAPSLELFKLSTQAQFDSDKLLKEWIQTGDNSTKIRSQQLLIQSLDYETRALDSFNKAETNSE